MARLWGQLHLKKHWRVLAAGVGGVLLGVVLAHSFIYRTSPLYSFVNLTEEFAPSAEYLSPPLSNHPDINPSFFCQYARTITERVICEYSQLADLDYKMSELYYTVRGTLPEEKGQVELAVQRAWLSKRDVQCSNSPGKNTHWKDVRDVAKCLKGLYLDRIKELEERYVYGKSAPLEGYYADGPDNRTIFTDKPDPRLFMEPRKVDFRVVNGLGFLIRQNQEVGQKEWEDIDATLEIYSSESSHPLETVRFGSRHYMYLDGDNLSEDIVVIRSYLGGASCCYIIHAFQTKPVFKRLLEHDNNFFSSNLRIVGKDTIELYDGRTPEYDHPSEAHASLIYKPIHYDLRNERWVNVYPDDGDYP